MCDACDRADEQRSGGIDRRLVLAGGLAAGLSPLLPRVAGAQEADDATTTTSTTTSTTTTTVAPKLEVERRDEPAHDAIENDFGFDPPRPCALSRAPVARSRPGGESD